VSKRSDSKPTFYVTTPIYYVNDVPHIGHAYTTIIADVLARFHRQAGREVFFLTGTDEHGQKIERAASARGISPLQLADQVVGGMLDLWKALNISYDFFIRTTMPLHEKGVQKVFQRLLDKGDITKGTYQGWYCVSDENFLAEDVALDQDGQKTCPDCGKKCIVVEEACYFFRLSAYQKPLLDFYERNPEFVRPPGRMNEVVSFVRQGLRDLSITRTTVRWGIPVPGDPAHTIYVWFDALLNYVTGAGFDGDPERFAKFWPADLHLIGKDILRFHAVFWPAFLMAAGFDLPRCVFGHGWWLKDEAKMSKSRGNVLDPYPIIRVFGPDPLRYFLMREIPIGQDGNFSHEGFIHRVNSDLANDLGNLVHRTLTMALSYFDGRLAAPAEETEADRRIREDFTGLKTRVRGLYESYHLSRSLEDIWAYITTINKYLADQEPWKIAKHQEKAGRLARILFQATCAVRGASYLVYPVMPRSAEKIWDFLGETVSPKDIRYDDFEFSGLQSERPIKTPQPLFPRVELKDFLAEESQPLAQAAAIPPEKQAEQIGQKDKEMPMETVSFDEFKKMDLRVAHILKAERVPGTDKLLKLEVDVGTDTRTLIAGVGDVYKPEDLTGKKLAVIVNLKPAVIRSIESKGMILAAEWQGKARIAFYDQDIPAGAKVK
jgi:methionyl-tRNA synthetase